MIVPFFPSLVCYSFFWFHDNKATAFECLQGPSLIYINTKFQMIREDHDGLHDSTGRSG